MSSTCTLEFNNSESDSEMNKEAHDSHRTFSVKSASVCCLLLRLYPQNLFVRRKPRRVRYAIINSELECKAT